MYPTFFVCILLPYSPTSMCPLNRSDVEFQLGVLFMQKQSYQCKAIARKLCVVGTYACA